MNEQQINICSTLRSLPSEEAVEWLLKEYQLENINWGEALLLIPHRSWSKTDQNRLAEYYLKKIPFSSSRGYETFLSFMSINNFVKIIKKYIPQTNEDKELLKYYLLPLLNEKANSEKDKNIVLELQDEIA